MNQPTPEHQLDVRCRCDVEFAHATRHGVRILTRVHADSCPLGEFINTHDCCLPTARPKVSSR